MPDKSVGTPTSSFGLTSEVRMGGTRYDQLFVDGLMNLLFVELGGLTSPEVGDRVCHEIYNTIIDSRLQAHHDLFRQKEVLREKLGFAAETYVEPYFPQEQFFNYFDVMKKLDELNEALQVRIRVLSNMLSRTGDVVSSDVSESSISVSASRETLCPSPQEEDPEDQNEFLSREMSAETVISSAPITPLDPNRPNGGRFFQPIIKKIDSRDVATTTQLDLHPIYQLIQC